MTNLTHFEQASSNTISSTKPILVLIPGPFAPPSWYEKITHLLEKAGNKHVTVTLPSTNSEGQYKTPPTMKGDGASLKIVISGRLNNGMGLLIVMHSYCGYSGTEATEGLARAYRQMQGKDGGVLA
jgi:hypothetical protein